MLAVFLASLLLAPIGARAATTTIMWDPPSFADGQAVTRVGEVSFPTGPTVFTPTQATQSPPQALRSMFGCESSACLSGASEMRMFFDRAAEQVSVRTGSDEGTTGFCFPEGTTCPAYARLVGYDAAGNAVADSRDVFVAELGNQSITKLVEITDPQARIRRASLYVGKGLFDPAHEYGNPVRAEIDDLVVSIPDAPPPPPPPTPPIVTLTAPAPNQLFSHPFGVVLTGKISSSGGIFAFCTRTNALATPPATECREGAQVAADGSFAVRIPDSAFIDRTATLAAFAYDFSGRVGSARVAIRLAPPPPPSVEIVSPADGRQYTSAADVFATGNVTTPGGLGGFCLRVNSEPAPTHPAECTDTALLHGTGIFVTVPVPSLGLLPGVNRVRAYVFDRWGQRGEASREFILPSDPRITAMEVTQGVQDRELPLNAGGPVRYSGAKLVRGGKTIVRVFVNQPAGVSRAIPMKLTGSYIFRDAERPLPPLAIRFPDYGPATVGPGLLGQPPLAQRADPNGAYTFTLPTEWTAPATARSITLRAEVNPPNMWPGVPECVGCRGNNSMTVTDVRFDDQGPITLQPVEIVYDDLASTLLHPDPSADVFGRVREVSPIGENGMQILPYAGEVYVGDLVRANPRPKTPAGVPLPRSPANYEKLRSDIFGRVAGFNRHFHKGLMMGVAAGPGPGNDMESMGLEAPVIYAFPPRFAPIAIATQERPLTGVTHEFLHQLGFLHAGTNCSGIEGQPVLSWPGNQRGRTLAVGLDPRQVNGRYPIIMNGFPILGRPGLSGGEKFDLMSYCASSDDSDAWLSRRNWDAFGGPLPNGIPDRICFVVRCGCSADFSACPPPISGEAVPEVARAAPATARTLHVTSIARPSGEVSIVSVERSDGRSRATTVDGARYGLRMVDATGEVVASGDLLDTVMAEGGGAKLLTGEVRAVAGAALEVTRDGQAVARREPSAHAPKVSIKRPTTKTRVGPTGRYRVTWVASDADGDPLSTRVDYSANDGRSWRPLGLAAKRRSMRLPARLFTRSSQARVRVVVSDGLRESAAVSARFQAAGAPPQVSILDPVPGGEVSNAAIVTLAGQAFGGSGEPLAAGRLRWFDGRRRIARGPMASISLARPGMHTIRLVAIDRRGRRGSDRVRIRVRASKPSFHSLQVPSRLAPRARRLVVRLGSTVSGRVVIRRRVHRIGQVPRRIVVPVRPGRRTLRLRFDLLAGGRHTTLTERVERR